MESDHKMQPGLCHVSTLDEAKRVLCDALDASWHQDGMFLHVEARPLPRRRTGRIRYELKIYAAPVVRVILEQEGRPAEHASEQ